ncbi:serine/threonine-protein kinase [Allokutzneria albata]|uniref:non-specific serine/threonine protein kinase n=1 Tax=Allokutzneria albata TaxID=211114 RepID=A0A1G9U115_ALLAB|nr:serine/threonine-protein kinase [Allokutzneria albata]SDM53740.1 Serine/threonine protein kinase [Allokutzneria albata]
MADEAQPGRVVADRYRLIRRVGAGGFGRVWEARDEVLGIDVAVKELWLPPALSESEQAERLTRATREARNAARLRDHPNIVAVHDVVIEDDVPWIIMGLVAGQSLEEHLKTGPLPAAQVAKIAADLLSALEAAHGAGVVHRDVKPANVLLADNGDALLADFGIAVHHTDTALTATGMLIGSVEYMAPERLNGTDGGAEGDLYSLGVTLFQALEGISPFRRNTPTATLTAVLIDEVPQLSSTGSLATLITRLLDKDPVTRPNLSEARALLQAAHEPTKEFEKEKPKPTKKIEEPPPPPPTPPPVARNHAGWAIAAFAGVVLLLFATNSELRSFVDQAFSAPTTTKPTTSTSPSRTTSKSSTSRSTTTKPRPTTTTTRFNSADLDRESTDKTPVSASALLPSSFSDAKNVRYDRKSSDVRECVTKHMDQETRNLLLRSRCGNAVAATYVDHSNQILVMVWVVPMPDASAADTAYKSADGGSWGILCPGSGPGSEICDKNKDTTRAARSGWKRQTHRYLIKSLAMYINLTQDSTAKPWLDAAAQEAVRAAGPSNYSGNR